MEDGEAADAKVASIEAILAGGAAADDTAFSAMRGTGLLEISSIHEIHSSNHRFDRARSSQLNKKINVYSFALRPEEHQPSGTCNFSRIDTATLEFGELPTGSNGNIYAVNYNVLRIMSGMGGLAYSN